MAELARYGIARDFYIPLIKVGVQDFAVGADYTPAAGDVKVSIDGGTAANITTDPTAITMGNGAMWKFPLSAAELTGKIISVTVIDAAAKAVEDQMFIVETYGHPSAMHPQLGIPAAIFGKFVTGTLNDQGGTTDLTQANDILNRRRLLILTGSRAGESTFIADYDATSGYIRFRDRLTGAAANNDEFVIL